MFGNVFSPSRQRERGAVRSYRPHAEVMEDRWCPALHITAAAQVLPGHQVQVTGSVSGGDASGLTVNFMGSVNANTTVDSNGNFSYTTSQASLGQLYITGNNMDTASTNVAVDAPDVSSLVIQRVDADTVMVSGDLTGIDKAGRTMNFSGVSSGNATTDSAGHFSFTTDPTSLGMISACATDLWGQSSDTETAYVSAARPVIATFYATGGDLNVWTFRGTVNAEFTAGTTIRFGGVLEGYSTEVQADGTFTFTRVLPSGTSGLVSAIATDNWGQESDPVWQTVG